MRKASGTPNVVLIVARNVRALRKAAALSQEELAHRADVDRTYISQVERKQRNVTIVVLARIAAALEVTPDKLLIPGAISSTNRRQHHR